MKKKIAALALAASMLAPSSAMAMSAHAFTDHPLYTKAEGNFQWAYPELETTIALDIFNGYNHGPVRRDVTKIYQQEFLARNIAKNMGPNVMEFNTWSEFQPGAAITRAEFATILARVTGLEKSYQAGETAPFTDAIPDAWYQQYLVVLAKHEVIRPAEYPSKALLPDEPITRTEIATWVARAAQAKGAQVPAVTPSRFADVPEGYRYGSELQQAVALGFIKGYPDGTFRPDSTANRAEAAVMIARLLPKLQANLGLTYIQDTIQAAHDVSGLYMRERQEIFPDMVDFTGVMGRFWTNSALEWRVNPSPTKDNCAVLDPSNTNFNKHRDYQLTDGLICGTPSAYEGLGSATENYLMAKAVSGKSYPMYVVQAMTPQFVTPLYAKVTATFVRYIVPGDNSRDLVQDRYNQMVYLRNEHGTWKVSGMGAELDGKLGRWDVGAEHWLDAKTLDQYRLK